MSVPGQYPVPGRSHADRPGPSGPGPLRAVPARSDDVPETVDALLDQLRRSVDALMQAADSSAADGLRDPMSASSRRSTEPAARLGDNHVGAEAGDALRETPASDVSSQHVRDADAMVVRIAGETSAERRRSLTHELNRLYARSGHHPAVRLAMARALGFVIELETDGERCRWCLEALGVLHADSGHDAAIRGLLARAIATVALKQRDPQRCGVLVRRLAQIHRVFGREPAVREPFAKSLGHVSIIETDTGRRFEAIERLEMLHARCGQEAFVREPLARALAYAAGNALTSSRRVGVINKLAGLYDQFPGDPMVTRAFHIALQRTVEGEVDDQTRQRLDVFGRQHPSAVLIDTHLVGKGRGLAAFSRESPEPANASGRPSQRRATFRPWLIGGIAFALIAAAILLLTRQAR